MALVAPSVLAANFSYLRDEIASAERSGVTLLHLDIMDGHFVPNLSFGPGIVKTINGLTDMFLDVHLMLDQPDRYFDAFIAAGADNISFHLEVHPDPLPCMGLLRSKGIRAGLAINPDMPIERAFPFLQDFDYLLIMSVFPGFGGQSFITEVLHKIELARREIDSRGLGCLIEVDGGVDSKNMQRVINAGADILVMGTAFFGASDRQGLVTQVQEYRIPERFSAKHE